MVPNGWSLIKLKDIGKCINGLTYSPKNVVDNGLLVLRSSNVQGAKLAFNDNVYVNVDISSNSKTKVGDILLCVRNGSRNLIGKSAFIDESAEGLAHGAFMSLFRSNNTPNYTFQLFQSSRFFQQVNQNLGATINSINSGNLNQFKFPYPPLAERKKIAQILSTWDRGIATTEKLIDASKQQKKALMQQLLTGKKRLGHDEGTYTFKQTRYGAIPTDWAYLAIKDIAVQKSEKNSKGLNLPVLSCSKYDGFVDSLKYFKKKVYSDDTSGYRIISKGCFGFPANHIEEGSIGLQNLYDKGIVSPIYVVFQANANLVENRFLYAILKTDHYRQIFSAATNASVDRRGSLRWKEFSAIHVSLPSLEEQKAIADVLELANKEIKLLQAKLAHFKQEKKALMQQLLTGKRRVSLSS
ncbi:restriction endonuclease subunit S [Photobacterium phosphoreum]|uniref:restriction endonuclease subunit S n=1 Tax=Photobacterium phosphoreum TaxID=659 RepID=UPI001E5659CB|nr:restriction endonuclease subunit S [Photobacterium phosphoreum]MCD9485507.1 restriction endonuclease subunit S [Photobacterium phosphoreum]